jgi:asparagine synthase (glutamine-hydrolysing)
VFTVAWGHRAVELLQRAAERDGAAAQREGPIAVLDAPSATQRNWRCWLSGRMTNVQELRERLGLPVAAEPVAVLAGAYALLGEEACVHLRGTFVAVVFDREREVAQVVRDHIGGRPLVRMSLPGGTLLAEHERAIVDLLPSAPAPDRLSIAQWIEHGNAPNGRTLFAGIERVPPAHRAMLSGRGCSLQRYWRPRFEGIASGAREEVAVRLRTAAFAAVARAAEGSRRPAVLLSGGLDSSCVAAGLAARRPPASPALALSGVFPSHPETDERELIEQAAAHTGVSVELIAFDERASILVPALSHIERWSLPPATPNLFVWEPVMARARELGVDAVLDGEGGDELFAFAPQLIADMLRRGRAVAAWRLAGGIPGIGTDANARVRLRALRLYGVSPLLPEKAKRWRRRRHGPATRPDSLLRADDHAALLALQPTDDQLDGPLWWRGLAEEVTQPGEALGVSAQLRRGAVDAGIDRRNPFLFDLDLLTTVLSSPPAMLFEVRDRALLRDALAGRIPEAVRSRREKSFFTGLLSGGLLADGPLLLEGPSCADAPVRAFVAAEALEALLRQGPAPPQSRAARRLWRVGLADAWLRTLERPGHPRELLERMVPRRLRAGTR